MRDRPGEAPRTEGLAASIPVVVNGAVRQVPPGTSVADVVAALVPDPRGLAVAVDREVVPRSRWGDARLAAGASIEIVAASAGG